MILKITSLQILPYNPEPITAVVDDTIMPEIYGARCDSPPTDIGDFILINASDQAIRTNQFQEAAALKSTHPTKSHESVSCEMHEIIRAQKKPSTWTRLDRASTTQKACPSVYTGACKRNFLNVDDHSELPSSKRQVLKDGAEFSFQVAEADDQPRQQS